MRPLFSLFSALFICLALTATPAAAAGKNQGFIEYYASTDAAPVIAKLTVVVDPSLVSDNPVAPRSRSEGTPWPLSQDEADSLADSLKDDLDRDLKKADAYQEGDDGGAQLRVAIVEAEPTNLKFTRAGAASGLLEGSIARGGATIAADFIDSEGNVIAIFSYSYFTPTLEPSTAQGRPWSDARRALSNFSKQLAKSLRKHGVKAAEG